MQQEYSQATSQSRQTKTLYPYLLFPIELRALLGKGKRWGISKKNPTIAQGFKTSKPNNNDKRNTPKKSTFHVTDTDCAG